MLRKFKVLAAVMSGVLLLTGCSQATGNEPPAGYAAEPLTETEDTLLTTQNITATDEELKGLVYNYVTGNIKIDVNQLIAPTESEKALIDSKIERIISALKGKDNNSISDDMLNYLLWEFSRTQKEWDVKEDGIEVLGIDPATRKIFVDISFITTNNNKIEIPQSKIIMGDPLEDSLKAARQAEYMAYLSAKYKLENGEITGSIFDTEIVDNDKAKKDLDNQKKNFENKWGTIASVLEEQQEFSLIGRLREAIRTCSNTVNVVYEDAFYDSHPQLKKGDPVKLTSLTDTDLRYVEARGVGTYTYTGISGQTTFGNDAEMKFRFVLDFDFNLGATTTITTSGVYLMNYTVYNYESAIEKMTIADDVKQSISVIKPYIDRKINSYNKAVEECNLCGLYSIFGFDKVVDSYTGRVITTTSRFKDWDKYYYDWTRYCYTKFDAYDYEIRGWQGNTIQVLITRSKKIRGRGTQMTMPSYTEKVLMTFVVDDDDIFLDDEVVLSTELVGEPISMIKDVTGVSDKIAFNAQSFSKENEAAVLYALQQFSKAQLMYAYESLSGATSNALVIGREPGNIDSGIAQAVFEQIKNSMRDVANQAPSEKITWLGTWATKSNVYCRVRVREVFLFGDKAVDTEAYVGLTNRDGKWTVVSYERTVATKTNARISDKGCLSHDYTDGRESTSDYISETGVTAGDTGTGTGTPNLQVPSTTVSTSAPATQVPVSSTGTPNLQVPSTTVSTSAPATQVPVSSTTGTTSAPSTTAPATQVPVSSTTGTTSAPSAVETSSQTEYEGISEPSAVGTSSQTTYEGISDNDVVENSLPTLE